MPEKSNNETVLLSSLRGIKLRNEGLKDHRGDLKPLHCKLSPDQFRLVRWAHLQKRGIDLGEFFRLALFDAVGKAVSHAASRNRLPPGVAKDFDLWRQEML